MLSKHNGHFHLSSEIFVTVHTIYIPADQWLIYHVNPERLLRSTADTLRSFMPSDDDS